MTYPPRSARRHLNTVVACGLLVLLGIGAMWWGRSHQYRPPPATAATSAPATHAAAPTSSRSVPVNTRGTADVAQPVNVSIPRLGLSEDLLSLGLDASGAVAVPSGADVQRVAWFNGSPRPGQPGPAVIEGHVITPDGNGPFHELAALKAGDRVSVRDSAGKTHDFTVYRTAQYSKTTFPTTEVYANTAGPELRLITCSGTFDTRTGHYDSNTVVYAH